jgi:uroporphyrinogen decarboxylase
MRQERPVTIYEQKLDRVQKALSFKEPDRIPRFDLFWQEFIDKWLEEKKLPPGTNINEYYDFDFVLCVMNEDPKIDSFTLIERGEDYTIFKSGFGCTCKKADYSPMPAYLDFEVKSADQYEDFVLDDPNDERRYYQPSANILSSSGNVEAPSFQDQMDGVEGKFPRMGLVLEGQEFMWRIRGMQELFIDLMLEEKKVRKMIDRAEAFEIQLGLNQIKMGVDLMFIGGDVAYDKGMFYSPDTWREFFKPMLRNMCRAFKSAKPDVKILYHGCGNASAVYDDMIECGIDAYQSLEVKAGLDVVELKKKYRNRLAFVGNIDVRDVLTGDKESLRRDVLRRLNAAKGGGYIPMSDHSVPDNVPVENYDFYMDLINDYGKYPLRLGEHDIPELDNLY